MTYSDPFIDVYVERHREYLSWYIFQDVFTDKELDQIIEIGEEQFLFDGAVGGTDRVQRKIVRDSTVGFIEYEDNYKWIFDRIASHVLDANEQVWNFDLLGFGDGLQYTKYYGGGGHYDWHTDVGMTVPHRKLSMVMQLSDDLEYEGGELQFNVGHEIVEVPKVRGTLVIFPTFLLHRVVPVTSGVRKSLVSWISGPNFR